MMRTAVIGALLLLSGQSSPNARDELASLRKQAHAAREAGDYAGYLQAALKVRTLTNNYPNTIESVARAYTEAGANEKALDALTEFADMGQVDEGMIDGSNNMFAPLAGSPRYKTIVEKFAANKTPVTKAEIAFSLKEAGLVAEDIDYDSVSKSFLITSVLEKKIVRVDAANGDATDFASSPSHWPMLAIKADVPRRLVWATEVALDGFTAAPKEDGDVLPCSVLSSGRASLFGGLRFQPAPRLETWFSRATAILWSAMGRKGAFIGSKMES